MARKLTLDDLLEWVKEAGVYTEMYGDGSAEVQFPPDFDRRVEGRTLYEALHKARRVWLRWQG